MWRVRAQYLLLPLLRAHYFLEPLQEHVARPQYFLLPLYAHVWNRPLHSSFDTDAGDPRRVLNYPLYCLLQCMCCNVLHKSLNSCTGTGAAVATQARRKYPLLPL